MTSFPYVKRYTSGFADLPAQTTPVDSSYLNNVEAALIALCATSPTSGQVPTWNATNNRFEPGTIASSVASVFGRTGTVAAATNDYTDAQIQNSPTNKLTATGDLLYASAANTLARRAVGTTGQILKVTGGVPVWADAPTANAAFSVYLASNTSIASGSDVLVQFDTAEFNLGSYVDLATHKGRFTPPAGVYHLGVTLSGQSSAAFWGLKLYKNGSLFKTMCQTDASLTGNPILNGEATVQASGTDFFEVYARASTTANLFGGTADTIFQGFRVGT